MGLFGKLKKGISRVVKKVGKTASKVAKVAGKPLLLAAGGLPAITTALNVLQPKQALGNVLGGKSGVANIWDKAQQATRIGTALAVGGAAGVGPLAGGGTTAGVGGLTGLAGKMLPGMSGGSGGGTSLGDLAGIYGAYQGYKGSEAAQEDISRYEGSVESNIKRQEELAGLDPAVAARMKHEASQELRGAQAERGIFESGVAAKQEAELMPQIEQQQKAWQLQQLAGISGQYSPLMESAGRRAGTYQDMAGGFGQALAGSGGGGGGGGFDLAGLAGQAWGGIKGLFGGGDQGYDLGDVSGGTTMTGGLSGIDYSNLLPKAKPTMKGGNLAGRQYQTSLWDTAYGSQSGEEGQTKYAQSVAESGAPGSMDWLKQQGYEVD